MSKKYALTGIGNAIVDVIASGTDAFLQEQNIAKGGMTLIDEARARTLYSAMGPGREVSGGSAANTMAGFASFGGKGAYLGKVADDQLGKIFAHDMQAGGTDFNTPPLKDGPATAQCLIVVTPDAQRSMSTYLGACVQFTENDVDEAVIANSAMIYLEGYLFDKDSSKRAYIKATKLAHANGAKVALSLSDSFCVEFHRADFQNLIKNDIDILFANEAEAMALYQSATFEDTVEAIRGQCDIVVITRSEKGSVVVTANETIQIPVYPVIKVVDTTGAGDQYAAGFLFGLSKGLSLKDCGALGALAAGEVISHVGPRPETPLAQLALPVLKSAA